MYKNISGIQCLSKIVRPDNHNRKYQITEIKISSEAARQSFDSESVDVCIICSALYSRELPQCVCEEFQEVPRESLLLHFVK